MRVMLGSENRPSLLVEVESFVSYPSSFKFWVVNGAWEGEYSNNRVSVFHPFEPAFTDLQKVEILSDNQDRLRGQYQEVFDNFSNKNYVAPYNKVTYTFDDLNDDIPF